MQLSQEQLNLMLEAISDAIQYTIDNDNEIDEDFQYDSISEYEQKKNEYFVLYRQIASLIEVKTTH